MGDLGRKGCERERSRGKEWIGSRTHPNLGKGSMSAAAPSRESKKKEKEKETQQEKGD